MDMKCKIIYANDWNRINTGLVFFVSFPLLSPCTISSSCAYAYLIFCMISVCADLSIYLLMQFVCKTWRKSPPCIWTRIDTMHKFPYHAVSWNSHNIQSEESLTTQQVTPIQRPGGVWTNRSLMFNCVLVIRRFENISSRES